MGLSKFFGIPFWTKFPDNLELLVPGEILCRTDKGLVSNQLAVVVPRQKTMNAEIQIRDCSSGSEVTAIIVGTHILDRLPKRTLRAINFNSDRVRDILSECDTVFYLPHPRSSCEGLVEREHAYGSFNLRF